MPAPPPSSTDARPADQAAGFAAAWLRAICPCARCRDPDSGQQLVSLTDLPAQVRVAVAALLRDGMMLLRGVPAEAGAVLAVATGLVDGFATRPAGSARSGSATARCSPGAPAARPASAMPWRAPRRSTRRPGRSRRSWPGPR